MRAYFVGVAVLAVLGCSRADRKPAGSATVTRPTAPVPPAPPPPSLTRAVNGRPLFCAHGGVGMVPDPPPPDFEDHFAVAVFEIDNPGPERPVTVAALDLLDAGGATVSTMRHIKSVVMMSTADRAPAPSETGSWAYYMESAAQPFDGKLPTGRSRLRVRVSLTGNGNSAERYRLRLDGLLGAPVLEGTLDGVWPT